MTRIDAHQHFWFDKSERDGRIDETRTALKQKFLPEDLQPNLERCGMDGCVAVQAHQCEKETHFLLNLAREFDWIEGVVGWVDLRVNDLGLRLDHFDRFPKLKGFRHNLETDDTSELLLESDFQDGLRRLVDRGYTYDILIDASQLKHTVRVIDQLPSMPLVLDHLGKPDIQNGKIDEWKVWMGKLSSKEHVHCKLSGLVTQADWSNWTYSDLVPYLDVVYDVFGPDRLMFGSDWPVCTLAAGYPEVVDILEQYMEEKSDRAKEKVFGETAVRFYNLN